MTIRADLAVIPSDEPHKALTAHRIRYGRFARVNVVQNQRWIHGVDLTRSELIAFGQGCLDLAATMPPEVPADVR